LINKEWIKAYFCAQLGKHFMMPLEMPKLGACLSIANL
jgi:hypothetical protein